MNICSLFCRPFVGNLTDKISKYKLSFIGAVLMAAASVGYAAAQSPLFIVAARIVNGIGFSLCSVCISTWMSTLLPKEKIGSGMGIYGAMNALAMAAAPAVGVSLYERIGYRPAFLVAAAFSILIVVVIQFVQNKGEPVSVASVYKGTIRSKPRNFGDFLCYPHSAYVQYASIVCLEKPRNSCGWSL